MLSLILSLLSRPARRYAVTLDGVQRVCADRQAALDLASKHYRATGRLAGLEIV